MSFVFNGLYGFNNIDYISCWFYKAKQYIEGKNAKSAFVSTNSICQGEQISLLWPHILTEKIEIDFAFQSFKWTNNAKGSAAVIVIIVGLRNTSNNPKYIFRKNIRINAKNINPYLIDDKNLFVSKRSVSISKLPEMNFGSMANDGGYLIFSNEEKNKAVQENPKSLKFFKKFVGAVEFTNNTYRWCLWIEDEKLNEAEQIPFIAKRIEEVEMVRLNSKRGATNKLASKSHSFGEIRHQNKHSILVPRVTSEKRDIYKLVFLIRILLFQIGLK